MPTKLKLTILARIANFINGLKSVNRCFIVVIPWLSQFFLSFQVELITKFTSLKLIYTI